MYDTKLMTEAIRNDIALESINYSGFIDPQFTVELPSSNYPVRSNDSKFCHENSIPHDPHEPCISLFQSDSRIGERIKGGLRHLSDSKIAWYDSCTQA